MQFGYFTLSENHYDANDRSANDLSPTSSTRRFMPRRWVCIRPGSASITSAPWVCFLRGSGARQCRGADTTSPAGSGRYRPAPANPIRVAEQWATLDLLSGGRVDFAAGRGYDRREYLPFKVSFEDNQEIFEEGMGVLRRLWSSDGPISHHGKHYRFENVAITPKPVQRPLPAYVASFSQPSIELAADSVAG